MSATTTIRRRTKAFRAALEAAQRYRVRAYDLGSQFRGEDCPAGFDPGDVARRFPRSKLIALETWRGEPVYRLRVHSNLWYQWPQS